MSTTVDTVAPGYDAVVDGNLVRVGYCSTDDGQRVGNDLLGSATTLGQVVLGYR